MKGAILSNDPHQAYRYQLWRSSIDYDPGLSASMTFIMLNPSTADAELDDPTIRRCAGFAKRERYERFDVFNLFALRATDPRELRTNDGDVNGPMNNAYLRDALCYSGIVVAAWGNHGSLNGREEFFRKVLVPAANDRPLFHLGDLTKKGQPRHPLYLPADAPLNLWIR